MSEDLSKKQLAFCREYCVDINATKAAERAGYSARTAGQTASRLLKNVKILNKINELQNQKAELTSVTAQRVVHELAAIGFSKITDVVEWKDGAVQVKDSASLSPQVQAAIKEVKIIQTEGKVEKYVDEDGNEREEVKNRSLFVQIKMHGKDRPLEMLATHTGVLDREKDSGDDELDEALKQLELEEESANQNLQIP